jgi:ArsR family transcriptional regulator, arsenate/arsenite/antimonite-responsive transcriptional repressor
MKVNVSTIVDECKESVVRVPVTTIEACCPPLLAAPLDEANAVGLAGAFKALADPVRLRLLSLIAAAPGGTACSCDLEEPVGKSQPTVSYHLGLLADAGLITKERAGRWVNCAVVPERLAALRDALGA